MDTNILVGMKAIVTETQTVLQVGQVGTIEAIYCWAVRQPGNVIFLNIGENKTYQVLVTDCKLMLDNTSLLSLYQLTPYQLNQFKSFELELIQRSLGDMAKGNGSIGDQMARRVNSSIGDLLHQRSGFGRV